MELNTWDKVLLNLFNSSRDKLSNCSQRDLLNLCLENDLRNAVQNFLNNVEKSDLKDSVRALQKKEEGNEKYKNKEYEDSLSLYTESIYYAPKGDDCLPLSYSNRSLALEKLGYPSKSIFDIDMALSCGYPEKKVGNLIIRKARCLIQLEDAEKAREILNEAVKDIQKKEYHKLFENELKKIKDLKVKKIPNSEIKLPEPIGGENEDFAFASKHLSVSYDKIRGRHVIAKQDFQPGDVLFVEKPYVFVTRKKLCFNCLKNTIAPIPCWTCTRAHYCSPKCRDDFWKSVHSFECGFSELLKSVGIAHLGLRVVLKASSCLDELKQILSNITEPEYETGSNICISKGYEQVYNLVHNSEYCNINDMFQYMLTGLLLALYMKNHTSYFPTVSDDEDLKLLTSVILRHILQSICNGFSIVFQYENVKNVKKSLTAGKCVEKKIGSAIYTSASMMNHSCEPSVTYNFFEEYIIIRAVKNIRKGEEVFISYGEKAKLMKRASRQEILSKQFLFQCKCQYCLQKFDIQDKFTAYKCCRCKGPSIVTEENIQRLVCLSCEQTSDLSLDLAKKHNKFYSLLKEGEALSNDTNLCLKKHLEAWLIGREIFYKFHQDVVAVSNVVARCLVELREFRRSILFLRCSVRSIEEQCGSLSYELLLNLKNLGDIITVYVINNENASRDLALEGAAYYRRVQQILSIIPEYKISKDLEINIEILNSHLRRKN